MWSSYTAEGGYPNVLNLPTLETEERDLFLATMSSLLAWIISDQ